MSGRSISHYHTGQETYNITDINDEKIIGKFCGKELQKTSQTKFRIKKVIKEKNCRLYMWNRKPVIIHSIARLVWKISIRMSQYFYELCERFIGSAKVELNLSNCVKKANLKGATGIEHLCWHQKQLWLAWM